MLVSVEKRFIFIHIPKTAGSSVTRALAPYCVKPERTPLRRLLSHLPVREDVNRAWLRTHDKATWARLKIPREFEQYFKFAVVRNPFDYAVSYYHFLRRTPQHRKHGAANSWTFLEYLEYLRRRRYTRNFSQNSWVTDSDGEIIVDEILRFETIDADFSGISGRLGLPQKVALPFINRSAHEEFPSYYGPREADVAREIFARDFELFGYDPRQV